MRLKIKRVSARFIFCEESNMLRLPTNEYVRVI
jgi:hypothetical protein